MADVNAVLYPSTDKKYLRVLWEAITTTNTAGVGTALPAFPDRSIQVLGNFGTAGAITIQGSNDGGTTWATLNDLFGNALTFTSAGIKGVAELTAMIRPTLSAGSGAVDLDVYGFFGGNAE